MGLTPQEIIEGNKLIASFMGDTKRNLELDPNVSGYHYHDLFDWLMPVVEKIEQSRDYYVKIYGNQAYVQCKVMGDTTILTSQKYVMGSAYKEENTKLKNEIKPQTAITEVKK